MTNTQAPTISVGRLELAVPQLLASADEEGPWLSVSIHPEWSEQMTQLVTEAMVLHLGRLLDELAALENQAVALTHHRVDGETVIRRVVGGDGIKDHLQGLHPDTYTKVTIDDDVTVWEPKASWKPDGPPEDKGVTDYL